jgi:hypothetical protein
MTRPTRSPAPRAGKRPPGKRSPGKYKERLARLHFGPPVSRRQPPATQQARRGRPREATFLRAKPRQQPGRQQVVCDHGASARVRRTRRLVQGIAALLRSKFLQLSCSNDRICDIVFTARWANNAHVVNCGRDLFCIGTADGAVHVLAPVVCDLMPQGMRTATNEAPRSQRVRRPMGPGSTRWTGGGSAHSRTIERRPAFPAIGNRVNHAAN